MDPVPFLADSSSVIVVPPSVSLEATETDQHSSHVHFICDKTIPMANVQQMPAAGDQLKLMPTSLYLDHVLWTFELRLMKETDGYLLFLPSLGSRLGLETKMTIGVLGANEPKLLHRPKLLRSTLIFFDSDSSKKKTMNLTWVEREKQLKADEKLSFAQLKALASNGVLRIRISLVAERAYFSLAKIIDLTGPDTVPEEMRRGVETILRGEKPTNWNCEITVAKNGRSKEETSFFVHKQPFANAGHHFKAAFQSGRSTSNLIVIVSKSKFRLPSITAADMKVLIPLVYGLPVPLHENLGRLWYFVKLVLQMFPDRTVFGVLFPHWQRAICQQALALDKSSLSSMAVLLRLLHHVWFCPYGAMPVAKRVAIGMAADTVHLSEFSSKGVPNDVVDPDGKLRTSSHFHTINQAIVKHIAMVSQVRKFGINLDELKDDEKNEEHNTSSVYCTPDLTKTC